MRRLLSIIYILFSSAIFCFAGDNIVYQRFFNLSGDELKIDSLLPSISDIIALQDGYQDSVYTVKLVYPEYKEITNVERIVCEKELLSGAYDNALQVEFIPKRAGYKLLTGITQQIVVDRRQGKLEVQFSPVVYKGKVFKRLSGFMLRVYSAPKTTSSVKSDSQIRLASRASSSADRYVAHSVLSSGHWAKIAVSESGIHQLTEDVIKNAGFSSLNKVKIYGYGGKILNEQLTASYLKELDDLQEVPSCFVGGKRLFYGQSTVSYTKKDAQRTRNTYSNKGYYLITESDAEPLLVEPTEFMASYPTFADYHVLSESDGHAYYQGGRHLFDARSITVSSPLEQSVDLSAFPTDTEFEATVLVTSGDVAAYTISMASGTDGNTKQVGQGSITLQKYQKANIATSRFSFTTNDLVDGKLKLTIASTKGELHLDYIDVLSKNNPKSQPDLSTASFPSAEYVYNITNQDLHADSGYDMVIIVPASQKLTSEANRLAAFHEEHDSLKVRVVPADEIYNEFSSGTPDVTAYRRYLKMLYDKSEGSAHELKYVLLFGRSFSDNRMLSQYTKKYDADDYLLIYESENSISETDSYPNDGYITLLDDGEGSSISSDREDIAVGRFPVRSADEAKILVDKTIAYATNANAGSWENLCVVIGDDGDNNNHMQDAERAAVAIEASDPNIQVRRMMMDAYPGEAGASGYTYPEMSKDLKNLVNEGALIFNYSGHGAAQQLSHEKLIWNQDFAEFRNSNLSLWIAAACDVSPFDKDVENIALSAMLNSRGGSIAFLASAREVFPTQNNALNCAFMRALFTPKDGAYVTMGEALRLAKNATHSTARSINNLTYALLGDPALRLNIPTERVVIDSINGVCLQESDSIIHLKASSVAKIIGHIESKGVKNEKFEGTLSLDIKDALKYIVCRNNQDEADTPFTYYERTSSFYKGNSQVNNGTFAVSFAIPRDIEYSGESGLITAFAVDSKQKLCANGISDRFVTSGTEDVFIDSIGPNIYCYLNTPSFIDGSDVNTTPFFYAEITDKDGINASGVSYGHDLQLVIDGDAGKTYNLNDNFTFDSGSYTSGKTYYSIPALSPGKHTLKFKAWDVLNNSSTVSLTFNVVKAIAPELFSINSTKNPARESTTFVVNHSFRGSDVTAEIEVMNTAGRPLWRSSVTNAADAEGTSVVDWDLRMSNGGVLQTGVYLYRVRLSSNGAETVSKAKKLIIIH